MCLHGLDATTSCKGKGKERVLGAQNKTVTPTVPNSPNNLRISNTVCSLRYSKLSQLQTLEPRPYATAYPAPVTIHMDQWTGQPSLACVALSPDENRGILCACAQANETLQHEAETACILLVKLQKLGKRFGKTIRSGANARLLGCFLPDAQAFLALPLASQRLPESLNLFPPQET